MRRSTALIALGLWLCLAMPRPAAAAPVAGAQFRYWAFSNDNDLRDWIAYWSPGPVHVQLEYWDFARGDDQFRPEIGLHLHDRHRSVYTVQWRHEKDDERFTFGTDQVLSAHTVARVAASPIIARDSTQWVLSGGTDYYWSSYNFFSWTVIHDPRGGDLWVVPLRLRLAFEETNWLQYTLAPASKGSIGWAVDVKKRWLRAGVEHNSRYDFTRLDNVIFTVGIEVPLRREP
jgi:hypothetical protein